MFYGHDLWSGGWLMFLWMFLFWGGLVVLGIWVLRALLPVSQPEPSSTITRPPLEIAKERYTHGEISREEFTEIVQNLEKAKPTSTP